MFNYYDFLVKLKYPFYAPECVNRTNMNVSYKRKKYNKIETISGKVIANSEHGARELIHEFFVGIEDDPSIEPSGIEIISCDIEEIGPIIPQVTDYQIKNMHYELVEE